MHATDTLSDLAATYPSASRIFYRHGLDFCCNGRRPLAEAAREMNLDSDAMLREIEAAEAGAARTTDWKTEPLPALIDHIVATYHVPLRAELPELVAMAAKVEAVHADKTTCPRGLSQHLRQIQAAVADHLAKEEGILFPLIAGGRGTHASSPIAVMEHEHVEHGHNLALTRRLTNDLTPPPEACATWQALYTRLGALERDLMEHIHLENNILFPRALNG